MSEIDERAPVRALIEALCPRCRDGQPAVVTRHWYTHDTGPNTFVLCRSREIFYALDMAKKLV